MIEFETICFLQNHKTGSTFMELFLKANVKEALTPHKAHHAPDEKRDGVFYFLCVRDPIDLYLSLFNFGLDGGGQVHKRMGEFGFSDYYDSGIDGFDRWLQFVLSQEFAPIVRKFGRKRIEDYGLMTWRYLRLAQFNFKLDAPSVEHVMIYENLDAELATLMDGPLAHAIRDRAAADKWIADQRGVNASNRRDKRADIWLSRETIDLVLAREAMLFDQFYPATRDRLQSASGDRIRINDLKSKAA